MTIGVLREPSFESRVSLLPEAVGTLVKKGLKVLVERNAGDAAFSSDEDYSEAGAEISGRQGVLQNSDVLLSLNHPGADEIPQLSSKILIGIYQPLYNKELMNI